ncbi:DUF2075 domain-containing protein [Alginatibacterium sediminis]|uniref:DUF2075 domain-containing protein n=1 Tax=Alginatibacterium sediminis TaxID=2164068 RepID=A0A420E8A7_9ALTE|nr:XrtA/PEP-CTERM system-associated ATPase [Alginatibacterium sediminis]RKF14403.1 DUF2075 domain-containing protein [Alginatibacterium sediminis]
MYDSFYGLSGKAFKLSPDPRFFFASPLHERAISYLKYGLSQGEGFIVITGPIGTGKTTIARSLLASVENNIVAAQIATTKLNPEELVRMVASEFGIETADADKATLLSRFETYLLSLHRQGKRALLVVDEAQNLPAETVEELRMLSNFQLDDTPLFQSFLLGQEELKDIIELPQMEQFRQRIIASCHLKPLTSEQTQAYIIHRLKTVGWKDSPTISTDVFNKISEFALGVPRKINILCDRLFLFCCIEEVQNIELYHLEQVLEEMSIELSGSLNSKSVNAAPEQKTITNNPELSLDESLEVVKLKANFHDVSNYLEEVILRKIKVIRYLDKTIEDKREKLGSLSSNS